MKSIGVNITIFLLFLITGCSESKRYLVIHSETPQKVSASITKTAILSAVESGDVESVRALAKTKINNISDLDKLERAAKQRDTDLAIKIVSRNMRPYDYIDVAAGEERVECKYNSWCTYYIPPPPVLVSARVFLFPGDREEDGYGLYSYLLIPENDAASRPRYEAAIEALFEQVDKRALIERENYNKRNINIIYIPLRVPAPYRVVDVSWFVDNFNYSLAKRVISYTEDKISSGPYLLSYLSPLNENPSNMRHVLVQDLSWVPPKLISIWIRHFRELVRKPRYWDLAGINHLMVTLRTFISIASEGVKTTEEAVKKYIKISYISYK